MAPSHRSLDDLRARVGLALPSIVEARSQASAKREAIAGSLSRAGIVPVDTCLVVFGSLARGEWTSGSDIDWALLVDGPADQAHARIAADLGRQLASFGRAPGPTGVFAGLAFSHQLVHAIGGEQDSNRNTTQRILLLLESASIPAEDEVRNRVVRAVISRYIHDDHAYYVDPRRTAVVPWFLLNDIVRYWRMMAVDLAMKRRERSGQGWAVRGLKLRMSRKLIFVAGLIACLLCKLRPTETMRSASSSGLFAEAVADYLFDMVDGTPLDLLALGLIQFGASAGVASTLLSSYEGFLGILNDAERRQRLEQLPVADASGDPVYQEARRLGTTFQDGLVEFLLNTDEELARHTVRFGVF